MALYFENWEVPNYIKVKSDNLKLYFFRAIMESILMYGATLTKTFESRRHMHSNAEGCFEFIF